MSVKDNLYKIKSCKENIKQAIIDKGVDMTNVAFTEYATKISEIQGGGGGDYLDIRASLVDYYSTAESVPAGAFYSCSTLETVELPNCLSVGAYAFYSCSTLETVELPNCLSVGAYAFYACSTLETVELPMCEIISASAFQRCSSLSNIYIPLCKNLNGYAFQGCSSLETVDLPNCLSVGDNAFQYCSSLETVDLPNCLSVNGNAFQYCHSLQKVEIPICGYIIGYSNFNNCSSLTELDLRNTYSCVLSTSAAFSRTPFASGVGSIYVHNAVLSQFQNATNWTYYSDRLVGVGDPNTTLLSFADGRVYGETSVLFGNYISYLNIVSNSITNIDLPNLKSTKVLFSRMSNLNDVKLPNLLSTSEDMFNNCSSLTNIDLPNCSYIGNRVFNNCSSLTNIDLPNCTYVGENAFLICSSLTNIDLPNCTYVGGSAFNGVNLSMINLPKCEYIGMKAFNNIAPDFELYVGTSLSTVCYLEEQLYENGVGENRVKAIYVPAALVDGYKSADGWMEYADKIVGI